MPLRAVVEGGFDEWTGDADLVMLRVFLYVTSERALDNVGLDELKRSV